MYRQGHQQLLFLAIGLALPPSFRLEAARKSSGRPLPSGSVCRRCQDSLESYAAIGLTYCPRSCFVCGCRARSQSFPLPYSTDANASAHSAARTRCNPSSMMSNSLPLFDPGLYDTDADASEEAFHYCHRWLPRRCLQDYRCFDGVERCNPSPQLLDSW